MTHPNPEHADVPLPATAGSGPAGRHMGLAALAILLIFATITLPSWGLAAETRSASDVTIAQTERITDDLYIAERGQTAEADGNSFLMLEKGTIQRESRDRN